MSPSFDDLFYLIPGLICYSIFFIFTPGMKKKEIGVVFTISFVISAFEYLLFSSLITNSVDYQSWLRQIIYFGALFLVPTLIGFAFSYIIRKKKFRDFFKLGHYSSSAWDYVFSDYGQWCYVIITLKDKAPKCDEYEKLYGLFDSKSLASEGNNQRDIFLSKTFTSEWAEIDKGSRGVLISSDQIKYIEVINTKGKEQDENKPGESSQSPQEKSHTPNT